MPIISYLEQLEAAAHSAGLDLRDAFNASGVGTTPLFRARGGGDLHLTTARSVMAEIEARREQAA